MNELEIPSFVSAIFVDGYRVRVNDNGDKDRNRVSDDDRND